MSNTQYGKTLNLRMDEADRQTLYFAVMQSIMVVSERRYTDGPGETPMAAVLTSKDRQLLRQLRSLLDRLENVQP